MAGSDFIIEPWKTIPTATVPLPPRPMTPPQPDITQALAERTESLIIERLLTKKGIPLDRLTEKLNRAAGVAPRQAAKIEARADAIIAREALIEKKADKAFSGHEAILTAAETGLDKVEASLKLMSNGGDPLSGSENSSQAETAGA